MFSSLFTTSFSGSGMIKGLLLAVGMLSATPVLAQSDPWVQLDGGIPGTNGVPVLTGYGSLYPGTTLTLRVTDAAPSMPTVLSVSYAYSNTSVYGGIAHTLPSAFTLAGATDGDGRAVFSLPLPSDFPGGFQFFAEAFVVDADATQGVALTNTVRGLTVDASVIPDPAVFYDAALVEAWNLANAGTIPWDLYDYLTSDAYNFDSNAAAVLDAITVMDVVEDNTDVPTGPHGGGGVVSGSTWVWKNIFGVEIARAKLQVPWSVINCVSTLGNPTFAGGMPLGGFTAHRAGAKWTQSCPPTPQCEVAARECGNFQICWKQKFIYFITMSSGCTKLETLCAPCP